MNDVVLKCAKMFGAGVILATALVHMLFPAVENLTNPCLPAGFGEYPALAHAICLFAVLALNLTQMLLSKQIHKRHRRAVDSEVC